MKQCLECGKEFNVRNEAIAKFCSKQCKSAHWRSVNKDKWLAYKQKYKVDGRYHQKCLVCSGPLNGNHKYCSDGCKQQVKQSCTKCLKEFTILEFPKGRRQCEQCRLQYKAHHRANAKYNQTIKGKYAQYKSSAKQRGIQFLLSKEQFASLWQLPCRYCNRTIETIGLDRLDSSGPYDVGNAIPCCFDCNRMKGEMTYQEWISHMKIILKNA